MYTPKDPANYAMMVANAFNNFVNYKDTLYPPVEDNSIIGKDWSVKGYILADTGKTIGVALSEDVPFGYVVQSKSHPTEYAVIIRGTSTPLEWMDNMKALAIDHPSGNGHVHSGFFNIYKTMRFVGEDKLIENAVPLGDGIKDLTGNHTDEINVSVLGHSLGATLATYLTYDLATKYDMSNNVNLCCFASPNPGTQSFVNSFHKVVPNYIVYNYDKDIVPDVPPTLLGYRSLPTIIELDSTNSQAVINDGITSNHHVVSYAAMLDYNYAQRTDRAWKDLLIENYDEPYCIMGENRPLLLKGFNADASISMLRDHVRRKSLHSLQEGIISPTILTALAGAGTIAMVGGYQYMTGLTGLATASATIAMSYILRDGGIEISSVLKARLNAVKQWQFKNELDHELKLLFKGTQPLDVVEIKIKELKEKCRVLYEKKKPELGYMSADHHERFTKRYKEASFSIELLEVTLRTQKMKQRLDDIKLRRVFTKEDQQDLVNYANMLMLKIPSNIHDLYTYRKDILSVVGDAVKTLDFNKALHQNGLSDNTADHEQDKRVDTLRTLLREMSLDAPQRVSNFETASQSLNVSDYSPAI